MQQLFDEWTTYERVVTNDYMHHRQYFDALISFLSARVVGPLEIIDLGCGDGKPVIPVLEAFAIKHYTGIDQSNEALDRARAMLNASGISFELHACAMQEGVRKLSGASDLIIASYSVHHLGEPEKKVLLGECRRLLAPGGFLAIIDVFLRPGESRSAYLGRWEGNARLNFAGLSRNELDELIAHVRENDIPETFATYEQLARSAGFEHIQVLKQGPEQLNQLIVIS